GRPRLHDLGLIPPLASETCARRHYPTKPSWVSLDRHIERSGNKKMYDDPGLLIPIFGIFMIIAIVIGPIWIRSYYREKERAQLHETLRTAYEKGQPPPPELIERLTGGGDDQSLRRVGTASESDLRRAIVLISVGIGLGMLGLGLGYGIS